MPEAPQGVERGGRQGHEAVAVAFGIADMHAAARSVDVGDRVTSSSGVTTSSTPEAPNATINPPVLVGETLP